MRTEAGSAMLTAIVSKQSCERDELFDRLTIEANEWAKERYPALLKQVAAESSEGTIYLFSVEGGHRLSWEEDFKLRALDELLGICLMESASIKNTRSLSAEPNNWVLAIKVKALRRLLEKSGE